MATRSQPRTQAGPAVAEMARSFARSLAAANRSPRTIATYREAITRLEEFLEAKGMPRAVDALTREHLESFIASLLERGRPSSARGRYQSLKQFFRYCVEEGELRESPMARMRPPHVPEAPVPVLAQADLKRLLRACDGRDFPERRDMALLLLIDTGVRRAELAGLRLADVDMDLQTIVVIGKGSRSRQIAFGRKVAQALDRYLRARSVHQDRGLEWLWLGREGRLTAWGIAQVAERRAKQAGVDHANLHRFRHTAAHMWLEQGSENGAMQHFGWRSRQMLGRYGASVAAERAREEHRRLSPADRL